MAVGNLFNDDFFDRLGVMWGIPRKGPPPIEGVPDSLNPNLDVSSASASTSPPASNSTDASSTLSAEQGASARVGQQVQMAPQDSTGSTPQPNQGMTSQTPLGGMGLAGRETSSTQGVQYNPAIQAQQIAAFNSAITAQQALQSIEGKKAAELYDYQQAQADALNKLKLKAAADEAFAKQREQEAFDKVQDLIDDYKNFKVDPNRANSGAEGALNTLGVALGAFGASLSKSPNYALEIVNRKIDQDIAAQEKEADSKLRTINMRQNAVAFFRQQGMDARQSYLAAKQVALEDMQNKVQQLAAKYGTDVAKASSDKVVAELEAQKQALLQQQYTASQPKTTTVSQYRPVAGMGQVDAETLNKVQTFVNENGQIKQYKLARTAQDLWDSAVNSGAPEVAVARFIAGKGGLDQGSFPVEFAARLNKMGLIGATEEKIRKAFQGGEAPDLLRKIGESLKSDVRMAEARAKPAVNTVYRMVGQQLGDALVGGLSPQQTEAQQGFTTVH